MRARQIIHTWDYHHGQATRVVTAGLAPLRGETMAQKQTFFADNFDHVRTALMQEPRGHRNMLGAILTDPVTDDGDIGMIFLSPQGFFEMCGDSTFSAAAALVDSGMFIPDGSDGTLQIKVDTVAGRVDVTVDVRGGEPVAITFDNVASYSLGVAQVEVEGVGGVETQLGYGGLTYAFVAAADLGVESLKKLGRAALLDLGTRVWEAARAQVRVPSHVGPMALGEERPIDLITLWEPLADVTGSRVANFYAPQTTGRTPSGTGVSARVAIEVAAGRLGKGEDYSQESLLGLRFRARPRRVGVERSDSGPAGVVPAVTARSFLMGTAQWVLHVDDPFRAGFVF